MKKRLLRFWKPLLAVIFWGNSFIATKIALEELNPQTIIFLRILFGAIFLLAIAIYTKRDFAISLKNHGWIFILAVIAVAHLWIQVTGLKYTSATNTGWIVGVTPVFMALLGLIIFQERMTLIKFSGIMISFIGLILLISKGNVLNIGLISHKGDFLVLASAFTWSVYSIVTKKITLGYSPMMTVLFLFILMAAIISPFTINQHTIISVIHLSTKSWLAVLFLGIFC